MNPFALTPPQEQVLALISAGSSISQAAQTAGVHRNTVHNWIHSAPPFAEALSRSRYWNAMYWREQAQSLAAAAVDAIRVTLTDPSVPAGLRLKAAQSILALASTPPPQPPSPSLPDFFSIPPSIIRRRPEEPVAPVPNSAQLPPTPDHEEPELAPAAQPSATVPNSAQSGLLPRQPIRRANPKIGRNDPCPCGSGKKFKRCCHSLADAGSLHAAA